jgi:hypothetical protein
MGSKYCKAGAVIFAKYQALIHSIQLKANQLNPKVFSTLQWNACSFSPMPVTHSLNRGLHSVSRGASMAAIDAARTTIGSAFDAANAFMRDFDQLPVIGQYPPIAWTYSCCPDSCGRDAHLHRCRSLKAACSAHMSSYVMYVLSAPGWQVKRLGCCQIDRYHRHRGLS